MTVIHLLLCFTKCLFGIENNINIWCFSSLQETAIWSCSIVKVDRTLHCHLKHLRQQRKPLSTTIATVLGCLVTTTWVSPSYLYLFFLFHFIFPNHIICRNTTDDNNSHPLFFYFITPFLAGCLSACVRVYIYLCHLFLCHFPMTEIQSKAIFLFYSSLVWQEKIYIHE